MGKDGYIQMGFMWESVIFVYYDDESIWDLVCGKNCVNYEQSLCQIDGGFGWLILNLVFFYFFCVFGYYDVDVQI